MASVLHRRMARLESALFPAPRVTFLVLIEPGEFGSADQWAEHRQQLEEGRHSGVRLGVVVSKNHDEESRISGVEYFASRLDASFAALANQPSGKGKANRLADLLDSLSGKVLGVSKACDVAQ